MPTRVGLVLMVVSMLACEASAAPAADGGKFVDLGPQITSTTIQGTTFAREPGGRDVVCTVIRGEPAKLLVFDVRSGEMLHRLTLSAARGAWNATTASDGSVYVGTDDNGHLYRWVLGEKSVADLGQVAPDQTFVWDEAAGADGELFVATYPGCQVIRYHPKDGFRDVGHGAVAPGENYARGLTYDPESGHLFVGVGARAHLVELDPKTGQKTQALPKQFADRKFAYSVDLVAGKLFVYLTDGGECAVIDRKTMAVEASVPDITGQMVVSPKSPYADKVYLNSGGRIVAYDLKTHQHEAVPIAGSLGVIGMTWITFDGDADFPGPTLVALAPAGGLVRYHPRTAKHSSIQLKVPPEMTPIQSIVRGPDGRIYCGGYLAGGLSSYDPKTARHEQFAGMSQAESMGVLGTRLFLGVYPRTRLYAFDTAKPWDAKLDNPHKIEELDRFDQDRPMATLGVAPLNKVFFGTVPDYGTLGGTLTIYDAGTDKIDVHRNVVQDQSIVTLTYADGTIIGGTSRSGGLGIEPKAKEAKLFFWDAGTNRKIFEASPVPGTWVISGLTIGPDKKLWGFADQTLFVFDLTDHKTVYTADTFPIDPASQHARWRNGFLAHHPSGEFYGTMSGRLFRLDPQARRITVLREHDSVLLTIDDAGRVYFRDRTNLWQYTPGL